MRTSDEYGSAGGMGEWALLVAVLTGPAAGQVTRRVSVDSGGVQGNSDSGFWGSSISGDGRYVAFESEAWNLVGGDTNGWTDFFVRDRGDGIGTKYCP